MGASEIALSLRVLAACAVPSTYIRWFKHPLEPSSGFCRHLYIYVHTNTHTTHTYIHVNRKKNKSQDGWHSTSIKVILWSPHTLAHILVGRHQYK